MAEAKDQKNPKVDVSSILSKEGDDAAKSAKKAPKSKDYKSKGGKKPKHKHTHIEHHYDAEGNPTGHTVRHQGDGNESSYAAKDLDEVHDGLEENLGEPNGDEGQEPTPEPQPQAQPMPQPGAGA